MTATSGNNAAMFASPTHVCITLKEAMVWLPLGDRAR